ncbi:MAG: carbohydrate porin, partial [Chlamydiae bacterium]|nr:carbohydrate porin [Chlamydiota bacterium]
ANKYHGVNFTFDSTQGVMLITEWAYLVNQGKLSHGMPGNYKIGYYYSTGRVDKYTGGSQRGNYGYYLAADQMVYRIGDAKSERGISPFAAFLFAPKDRNQFPFFLAAGIVSLAVAYGAYSSELHKMESKAKKSGLLAPYGPQPQTAETVIELNYWLQATKWVAITPDIQYVINPKGYGTIQNALVIGLQLFIEI